MRLASLLSDQPVKIAAKITDRYQDHHSWRNYSDNLVVSKALVTRHFKKLSLKLSKKYLDVLENHYLLTTEQFSNLFGAYDRKVLQEHALYLWHKNIERFIPPDEIVKILMPETTLLPTLIGLSKQALLASLPTPSEQPLHKCQLVFEINRRHRELYVEKKITPAELDKIIEILSPFMSLIDCPPYFATDGWEVTAKHLGIMLPPSKHYYNNAITFENIKIFSQHMDPLLHSHVIFIKGDANKGLSLTYNPTLKKIIEQQILKTAQSSFKQMLDELTPLPATIITSKYTQLSHISSRDLYRLTIFILSWLDSKRLSITQQESIKVNDLRRFTKKLSADSVMQNQYQELCNLIFAYCLRYNFRERTTKTSRWQALALQPQQEVLKHLRKDQTQPPYCHFVDFLKEIPKEQWFSLDTGLDLFDKYLETKVLTERQRTSICKSFNSILFYSQKILGIVDLLIPKIKTSTLQTASCVGFRRVSAPDEALPTSSSEILFMQSNLEIDLPPDIAGKKLFSAARIFDIASLNTLKLSQEGALNVSSNSINLEKALSNINELLGGQIPQAALKLIEKTFKQRTRIYFDGHCVYLYDPSAFSAVRNLISDSYVEGEIDGRLIILKYLSGSKQLVAKFERNNIVVEQPEDSKDDYYRWAI